jgi:hypothetical protein
MNPVALAAAAALVLLLVCAGLVRSLRSARSSRRRADQAQQELASLVARVDELAGEVRRAGRQRHERAADGREYVITTLGTPEPDRTGRDGAAVSLSGTPSVRGPAGAALQRRLVTAIRRSTADRPAEEVLVSLAVRTVAVGHGVRRALSAENRDRIGWEMRRAMRHSRRVRRQELRAARREARARRVAAARTGRAATAAEDAA